MEVEKNHVVVASESSFGTTIATGCFGLSLPTETSGSTDQKPHHTDQQGCVAWPHVVVLPEVQAGEPLSELSDSYIISCLQAGEG